MTEVEDSTQEATLRRKKLLLWKIAYAAFSLLLCIFAARRLLWAWPEVTWQSNFWFITDVDKLLNGDYAHVTWFVFGQQFAMNGYRWFEYINASLFGLDSRLENIVYYAIVLCLSLLVGLRVLKRLGTESGTIPRLVVFSIPIVLATMAGAGSRGMELGTFTGVLIEVALFLLIDSRIRVRPFLIVSSIVVPLTIFVFIGGYVAGPIFALAVVWLIQRRWPKENNDSHAKLGLLLLNFLVWGVAYFLTFRALSPAVGGEGTPLLVKQMIENPLFPVEYLFWGGNGGIVTAQSLEALGAAAIPALAAVVTMILLLAVLAVLGALRVSRQQSTVPLILVFYPLGMSLVLLFTRNTDSLNLLSTWYSLHFKVSLVGVIWLVALNLSAPFAKAKVLQVISLVLLSATLVVAIASNAKQYERQVSERSYFLDIARASLFPEELTENSAGLTPLAVPLSEALVAIDILKRHHLGVYRNPSETLSGLSGASGDFFQQGESWADGWVGKDSSLVITNDRCQTLEVTFRPSGEIPNNTVSIETNFGENRTIQLSNKTESVVFHLSGSLPRIDFHFDNTWQPNSSMTSTDDRALASIVTAVCK